MSRGHEKYSYQPQMKYIEELHPKINNASFSDEFKQQIKAAQKDEVRKMFDEYENSGLSPEEVKELAQAKAEGRLVVLPCKVGDVVWKIKAVFSYFSKPMEDRVERIIISSNEILVCCTSGTKFSVNSIGKTVFLTREAAEKAIAEVGE